MTKQSKSASSWQQQNISNTKVLMGWTFAWLCSMALVKYAPMFLDAPGFLEDKASFLHLIFIIINILVGAMMIWANKLYISIDYRSCFLFGIHCDVLPISKT